MNATLQTDFPGEMSVTNEISPYEPAEETINPFDINDEITQL
jgi:hypothetical protein